MLPTKSLTLRSCADFSRRFDSSYQRRRDGFAMERGDIGRPSIIRSQTCDKLDPSGFLCDYAQFSGGIFVDCNVHDVDLTLWFFGQDSVVKSVTAVGITAVEPGLAKWRDVDNGVGVVGVLEREGSYFYGSRMMAAGQHDMTEIIGTEGKIVVNGSPQTNLVEMHEASGVEGGIHHTTMVVSARRSSLKRTNSPRPAWVSVSSSQARRVQFKTVEIGCALQESLRSGKKIEFDQVWGQDRKLRQSGPDCKFDGEASILAYRLEEWR